MAAVVLLLIACGGEQGPEVPQGPDPFELLRGAWSGTAFVSVQDTDVRCTLGGCSGTLLSRLECPAESVLTSSNGVLMGTISIDEALCSLVSGDEPYVTLNFDTSIEGVAKDVIHDGVDYEAEFEITLAAGGGSIAFQQLFGCSPREPWVFVGSASQGSGVTWGAMLVKKGVVLHWSKVNDIFARCGADEVVLAMSVGFRRS